MSNDPNIERERSKNPKRTAAVALLFDEDGKVLLVRTKRLPNEWQPIGGGVKAYDLSPSHTVAREILEETGLHFHPDDFVHIMDAPYDFGDGTVYFFKVAFPKGATLIMDESELEEWRWISLSSARSLPMFPATSKCLDYLDNHPDALGER
jgi:8-oxo-dGTP pyrophosphatase MutT (NUDIX family)